VAGRGEVPIEVTFAIDANGIVNVSASDRESGQRASTTIHLSSGLSEGDIQKAIQDQSEADLVLASGDPLDSPVMDADFILDVERRAAALDELDYFEVLRIRHDAGAAAVKAAYHRESRACHPDRFAALPSPELREVIARVYRRVTEAYTVLRDDAKRARYLADVTGPRRKAKLRFTEAEEVAIQSQRKQKLDGQLGQTVPGRTLFAAAFQDAEAGRWEAAERAIKTALVYEPANPRFRELLARIERSRPRADPFKIS
jgi:hypothetical protein